MLWKLRLKFWLWRSLRRYHPESADEDTVAIIESYKRPQNINTLVKIYLKLPFIRTVIVSNNNRLIDINEWITVRNSRLKTFNQPIDRACHFRYELARREKSRYFVFNDDDIFLSPTQISRIVSELRLHPSCPHGVQGQLYSAEHDSLTHHRFFVIWQEKEADVINRFYACTNEHVCNFFGITGAIGPGFRDNIWYESCFDDLVLSFCGTARPMIHNVGRFLDCPTQAKPGIAEWKKKGFFECRLRLFHKLRDGQILFRSSAKSSADLSKTCHGEAG